MSMNGALAVGAVFVAFMGTIAGACKHSGDEKTSATPNSVRNNNNTVSTFSYNPEVSRKLGAALCAA
jgi:hypothetical protein